MSKINTDAIEPVGSTLTLGASGNTISIPAGATIANSGTATGFGGGSNAPAFHINKTTTGQTIADDTLTKVSFTTTVLDTDSGVDLANDKYVVPTGEGGKYFIYAFCNLYPNSTGAFQEGNLHVRVNGTTKIRSQITPSTGNAGSIDVSGIVTLAAADYVEMFIHSNVSSSDSTIYAGSGDYTFMGAFKLDGIA